MAHSMQTALHTVPEVVDKLVILISGRKSKEKFQNKLYIIRTDFHTPGATVQLGFNSYIYRDDTVTFACTKQPSIAFRPRC